MAIIINDPYARGGGGVAGQKFGEVLSSGLQQLADTKLKNMERRRSAAELMPLVGNDAKLAYALSGNKDLANHYFKNKYAQPRAGAASKPMATAEQILPLVEGNRELAQILGANPALQKSYFEKKWGIGGGRGGAGQEPNQELNAGLNAMLGLGGQEQPQPGQQPIQTMEQAPQGLQQPMPGAQQMVTQPTSTIGRMLPKIPANATPAEAFKYASMIQRQAEREADLANKRQDIEDRRRLAEEKNLTAEQRTKQRSINESNKPWKKEHEKEMFIAAELRKEYTRIRELIARGDIEWGLIASKKPTALLNEDSKAFNKSTQNIALLRMGMYKGRATDAALRAIEASKPNLALAPETNLDLVDSGEQQLDSRERQDQFKSYLIDQNGGLEPADLGSKVMRLESQYEKDPQSVAHILGGQPSAKEMGSEKPVEQTQQQPQPIIPEQQQTQPPSPPQPKEEGPQFKPLSVEQQLREGSLRKALSPETKLGKVLQAGVQGLARGTEAIVGQFGNADTILRGIGNYISGGYIQSHGEKRKIGEAPPSSSDVREMLRDFTGGYTEPKGQLAEAFNDFISDLSHIFLPGKAVGIAASAGHKIGMLTKVLLPFSGQTSLQTAATLAGIGTAGSETAKSFGAGPVGQAMAKIAFMTGYGIKGTNKAIDEVKKANYKGAQKDWQDLEVDAAPIAEAWKTFKNKIDKSASPYADKLAVIGSKFGKSLDETLLKHTKSASHTREKVLLPAKEVVDRIRDGNQWMSLASRPTIAEPSRYLPKEIKEYLHDFQESMSSSLVKSAKESDSQQILDGLSKFSIAQDIHRGQNALGDVGHFLKHHVNLKEAFESGIVKAAFAPVGYPVLKLTREGVLLQNMLRHSEEARSMYANAFKAASEEKLRAFMHHATKLDKKALAYEERMKQRKK
jgi:hypothetical protein